MMLTLAILSGGLFVLWRIFRMGDDLHAWRNEWRIWKSKTGSRRNSPALILFGLAGVVFLFVRSESLRMVGGLGAMTVARLAWLVAHWMLERAVWFGLLGVGWALVQQQAKRRKYMGGEPATPRGEARAASRSLIAQAVMAALPALKGGHAGEDKVPSVGKVSYLSARLGDRHVEYGVRVRLHMRHGFTPKSLREFTSDGMAPEDDRFATYVNSHIGEAAGRKSPEARAMLAYTGGEVPVLPYSAITYVTTANGSIDPSQCDLLLLRLNPLTQTIPYPTNRPKVASLGTPLLVGADLNAKPVRMLIREQMTGVFGSTNSGKSFYVLNLGIGASQCENVAFVIIDMKGPSGDLMSMQARAAACMTDHEEATVGLQWLINEMDRRAKMVGGGVGKLSKFTRDCPEIVVFMDEWHEFTFPEPDEAAAKLRLRLLDRLIRRARAFGIYIVAATQIVHAKDVPTSITGQFHNVVSTRLGKRDHSNMVFQGQLANNTGPHLIPPDWRGVAYGRFDQQTIEMMRSLLSGPDVAARWAEVDAKAGLNVPLPGLAAALAKHREFQPALVAAAPAPPNGHATEFSALPVPVASAVSACCEALGVDVPGSVTAKELRGLSQRAVRLVANRKGVTDVEREAMAGFREAIRQFTNPDT